MSQDELLALRAVAQRLGWEVEEEVRVEGSAWNVNPPEKNVVVGHLRAGRADVLAVWDIDRWSRKMPVDVLNEVVGLEKHLGVSFYPLSQPFLSTATMDPGMRQAILGMYAWMSEAESRKRSERVRAAVAAKRVRAGNIGRDPKWGRGKIPSEAALGQVRELRASDPVRWTVRAIGAKLALSKSTVGRILSKDEPE